MAVITDVRKYVNLKEDLDKQKPDCDKIIKSLKSDELEAFVKINQEVNKRISYGIRNELTPSKNSTFLIWSNASKGWYTAHPDSVWVKDKKAKGVEVRLDANQMVVPYPRKTVNKFVMCLKILPLYACSTEAKMRGEVNSSDATLCWALKQLERIQKEKWREKNK